MKKTKDGWKIIKALNKHNNLAIKLEKNDNNRFKFRMAIYNNDLGIITGDKVYIDNILDLRQFMLNIEKVMANELNVSCLYKETHNRNIYIKRIDKHTRFKVDKSLKVTLSYRSLDNRTDSNSVTLSIESVRNLYRYLLLSSYIVN